MAGIDKSTQRVIAVIALLMLAAWALRGYLPGSERVADREPPPENPAASLVVVALVCAAVAVMCFAIVVRLRDRRVGPAAGALPGGSSVVGRPTWRFALVALALVIGWLLLVMVLSRVSGPIEEPTAPPTVPATPATPAPGSDTETPPGDPEPGPNVIGYLVPPMLVLMALVVVGTAIASRRQRTRGPDHFAEIPIEAPTPAVPEDSLARAAEVGLAEIADLTREPREAIIACYAAMESELMRVPGAVPQDHDTPTEVLARAVDQRALRADSATELVELFEEARFSPHVMTEKHRDAAVRVLHRVLAELPPESSRSLT